MEIPSVQTRLSAEQYSELIEKLHRRFCDHMNRHEGIRWEDVHRRLETSPEKVASIHAMEKTGGEPDVVCLDADVNEFVFCDCSPESPEGRRSLCYDQTALDSRKSNKPQDAAVEMAQRMGIELLTEAQYRALQQSGSFDTKTSSWIRTPETIRALGGALFCDRRYDTVFVYHNGAESYYAVRGFRGILRM
jgi:hypothetical protein